MKIIHLASAAACATALMLQVANADEKFTDAATTVSEFLAGFQGDPKDIADAVTQIRTALNVFESKEPSNYVKQRAETLTTFLGLQETDFARHAMPRGALVALIEAAEVIEQLQVVSTATRWAEDLDGLIDGSDLLKSGEVARTLFRELQKKLEAIENVYPKSAVERRLADVTTLLGTDEVMSLYAEADLSKLRAASDAIRVLEVAQSDIAAATGIVNYLTPILQSLSDEDRKQSALVTAVTALQSELAKFQEPEPSPRLVHVISAWYGEFGIHANRCNARLAMLTECQKEPECGAPSDLNKLCGYDPAPFTTAKRKGLQIEYACLPEQGTDWAKLITEPAQTEGKLSLKIRSHLQRISCTPANAADSD